MATDSKGELHNVKRVFTRSPSSISTSVQLRKYSKTLGWDALEFWPAKILENWDIKLMRAARTKIPSLEMETIWSIDQSVEEIKRLNFTTNDVWRIDYWIQVLCCFNISALNIFEHLILVDFIRYLSAEEHGRFLLLKTV